MWRIYSRRNPTLNAEAVANRPQVHSRSQISNSLLLLLHSLQNDVVDKWDLQRYGSAYCDNVHAMVGSFVMDEYCVCMERSANRVERMHVWCCQRRDLTVERTAALLQHHRSARRFAHTDLLELRDEIFC